MSDHQSTRVPFEGEFFAHRLLWYGAEHMRTIARDSTDGSYFCRVSSLLFMCFAVEGFVNDLLMRTRPETWKNAREFFRRGDYRGTVGKLSYLLTEFDVTYVRGGRPFQTVSELFKRRDLLVHPTTEKQEGELEIKSGEHLPRATNRLSEIAEPAFLVRARADVEEQCDQLQRAAYDQLGHAAIHSYLAFNAPMGWRALLHGSAY